MLRAKGAVVSFDSPEVLEERNKRIAALVGKKLGYSPEKVRDLCKTIDLLAKDPSPQKLVEFLYEKIWPVQARVKREDIQKAINKCHEDALGWLQNTYQHLHDN